MMEQLVRTVNLNILTVVNNSNGNGNGKRSFEKSRAGFSDRRYGVDRTVKAVVGDETFEDRHSEQ